MVRKVFRCAVGTRVFAWAVIAGGLAAVAGLVAMIILDLGMLPIVIALLALAVFGMLYLWRFALHPKVVIDDRLWIVNPTHTHILELDEVTDIRPGPNGLLVSHTDGVVEAWAIQKSTSALRKGHHRRADRVAEVLRSGLPSVATSAVPAARDTPDSPDTPDTADTPDTPDVPSSDGYQAAGFGALDADEDGPDAVADSDEDEVDVAGEDDEDDADGEDLIIRRAHLDDLTTLVALEEEINTEALAHVFTDGEPFPVESVTDRWTRALGDRSVKVRVVEIDGDPVGYLCYDAEQLHQVGVLPRHTGRGHGRSLLEYATEDMAARGTSAAHLQVLEANEGARGFYRHLGWSETGDRRPCPYPPHPIELTMSRTLDLDG